MVRDLFANKVPEKGTLLAHDNPDHDRLRKSVASFFVPRRLERFEPMLRAAAHDMIDKFVDDGSVEIKSHFAIPVPLRCIVVVTGLDPAKWEWIGLCLSLFGGITKSEEKLSIQQRNERDAGVVNVTDFEHLSMWRVVTKETRLEETVLKPGDKLFVAHNSGSRDSTKFNNPDVIDVDRRPKTQHLGFGRGVHACLGAPFARLLLRTELSVLNDRLPNLRLDTPYETIRYSEGPEGRGPEEIKMSWDPPSQQDTSRGVSINSSKAKAGKPQDLDMVVSDVVNVTSDVMQLTLRSIDDSEVPLWTPGAHIDVKAGTFGFRQYSVCSGPDDRHVLKIAVLEENNTGASHFIHANVRRESRMTTRGPRNNLAFVPGSRRTIFIAAGIGIIPIKPIAAQAKAREIDCLEPVVASIENFAC
ncbi:hypothetical protein INS49_014142 [Diaporthe citri]|uniref:uncharacterized protein n=1 Tax=Diaporthe citri TaxID=83186 RepID=UPI001C8100EC|nr:uncharacterized protein INS49_014142 [Diaporthe citri]KAG6358258.1 hypothetical protein INS49_014142 [Diaporthe citri]